MGATKFTPRRSLKGSAKVKTGCGTCRSVSHSAALSLYHKQQGHRLAVGRPPLCATSSHVSKGQGRLSATRVNRSAKNVSALVGDVMATSRTLDSIRLSMLVPAIQSQVLILLRPHPHCLRSVSLLETSRFLITASPQRPSSR
jgi:hypothetical protein